jgi:UDP-4-amino-4,6-dideoxy-N-acetyl-beta-L-altrosamine N-acetyltransferase
MRELSDPQSQIRPMVHADLGLVLSWRNHPAVRRSMFTQHEITQEEHQRWFERCLREPKKHLLVFELNHQPLGFVNFSEKESSGIADWGFYTDPESPKGTGGQFGRAALDYAFTKLKFQKVCGQALADNKRSIKFHQSQGFEQEGVLSHQYSDGEQHQKVICFGLLSHKWHPITSVKKE